MTDSYPYIISLPGLLFKQPCWRRRLIIMGLLIFIVMLIHIKRWMSRKKILKSKFLLTHKNPTIPLVPVIRDLSPGIIDCSLTNRLHQHERIEPHSWILMANQSCWIQPSSWSTLLLTSPLFHNLVQDHVLETDWGHIMITAGDGG